MSSRAERSEAEGPAVSAQAAEPSHRTTPATRCHPERSVAKPRDLQFAGAAENQLPLNCSVIRSKEGCSQSRVTKNDDRKCDCGPTSNLPLSAAGVYHFSAKSLHAALAVLIRAIFFSRRQLLSCFSRAMAFVTSPKRAAVLRTTSELQIPRLRCAPLGMTPLERKLESHGASVPLDSPRFSVSPQ